MVAFFEFVKINLIFHISIRCVSPRLVDGNGEIKSGSGGDVVISRFPCSNRARSNSDEEKEVIWPHEFGLYFSFHINIVSRRVP
jgi:hypothetical protein